ncbi:MAG: tetratricopeptide repeat protein [Deltaproteobacteria bacterium]|nr:tetratricopeptide repeat protein [Deltaproteobacteria bacterium]
MPPQSRMELEIAEAEYKRNLEKEEKLGRKEGMADAYGKLGTLYITLGHLDKAEDMFKKSLKIEEKLDNKEGMASDYGYLGTIYQMRDDLEQAEAMFKKSLKINQELGRKQGMLTVYGKLAEVYYTRRDFTANWPKFTIPVVIWIKPRPCLKSNWKWKKSWTTKRP